MDFYKVLGVRRDADRVEIGRAYRQRVQEIHAEMECRKTRRMAATHGIQPNETVRMLSRVQEAFSVLRTPKSRHQLDVHLAKLDQNQYEKFGPSWHRWYVEDRARSGRMREKKEGTSGGGKEMKKKGQTVKQKNCGKVEGKAGKRGRPRKEEGKVTGQRRQKKECFCCSSG